MHLAVCTCVSFKNGIEVTGCMLFSASQIHFMGNHTGEVLNVNLSMALNISIVP
jgi:hypothetical protein